MFLFYITKQQIIFLSQWVSRKFTEGKYWSRSWVETINSYLSSFPALGLRLPRTKQTADPTALSMKAAVLMGNKLVFGVSIRQFLQKEAYENTSGAQ